MGTLAVNRKGFITGAQAGSYTDGHGATTGTATDSATGNQALAIQYLFSTGRGSAIHRFTRTFLHFNTQGLSAGSSFILQITGNSSAEGNVIAVKHTAGNSSGGELANADFNNIDRTVPYSASTAWSSSSQVSISLNAVAIQQIISEDNFNIALIGIEDFNAEEENPLEAAGDITRGVAFSSTIQLSYTDAASGYTHKINGVAAASIGKVNTVATASLGKINTVD